MKKKPGNKNWMKGFVLQKRSSDIDISQRERSREINDYMGKVKK